MLRILKPFELKMLRSTAWVSLAAWLVSLGVVAVAGPPGAGDMYDMEASGFVMPATGPMPEGAYAPGPGFGGGVSPAGYTAAAAANGPSIAQVGYTACDAYPGAFGGAMGCNPAASPFGCGLGLMGASCGTGCDGAACGNAGCGGVLSGGILGAMCGEDSCGPGGLSGLRHLCVFCRGQGCAACQMFSGRSLLATLAQLRPYAEAGRCAQRWYDLSAEAMFLGHTDSLGGSLDGDVVSTQGVAGTPALRLSDTSLGDIEAGVRLSAAFIFGVGGNVELTYIGGHEWGGSESTAFVETQDAIVLIDDDGNPATPDVPFRSITNADDLYYSFLSDFGVNPPASNVGGVFDPGGFDDPDASEQHTLRTRSRFHSGEVNYRRRVVGPYCRFQGSGLIGFRYVRFDNLLGFTATGNNDNALNGSRRFFDATSQLSNDLYGAQIGGDLWYTMVPGINIGIAGKLGYLNNNRENRSVVSANSLGAGATPGTVRLDVENDDTTVLGEFETAILYRLSHSWTAKASYYLLAVDDIGMAGFDVAALQSVAQGGTPVTTSFDSSSLVIQGFGFGAEYTW